MTSRGWKVLPAVLALALLACVTGVAVAAVVTQRGALRPKLRLGCENAGSPQLLVKPVRCVVNDPTTGRANSVDLHRLRWSRWATSGATATGIECAFRPRCTNTKVRVTLSRLKRVQCAGNRDYRVFTQVSSTGASGTITTVGAVTCPDRTGEPG
jgi:hypothetical protein